MPKHARTTLVAAVLATVSAVALSTPARADTARTAAAPVPVTISSRTATLTVHAAATGIRAGWRHVTILAPAGARLLEVGHGASRTADVPVRVTLATRWLKPGTENELVVQDDVTGEWSTISLAVHRRSELSLTYLDPKPSGQVLVRGALRHYKAGRYVPSRKSPVRVQQLVDGRWTTLATSTTNRAGTIVATVHPLPGAVALRLSRPTGATVTAAVSAQVMVR